MYTFDSLVGNVQVISVLRRELLEDTLDNFIIFEGDPGTGKSTCAEIIALYMSCDSPINGNPCGTCKRCTNNIAMLKNGNRTPNFVKYNMANPEIKSNLNQIIQEVFKNLSPVDRVVYIFEEFHALSKNEQSSLLEEFRTLDDTAYVIATTTKINEIIPEIRSRANIYSFNRLTKTESRLLLHKLKTNYDITLNTEQENMMIEYSKCIPRNLIKIFEHFKNARMNTEELATFCNSIPNKVYLDFLEIMSEGTLAETLNHLEFMLSSYRYNSLIEHFFEFMVNATFYLSGGNRNIFTTIEISRLRKCLDLNQAFKIDSLLERFRELNEAQFKLLIIKVYNLVNTTPKLSNSNLAAKQFNESQVAHKELKRMEMNKKVEVLDDNTIRKLLERG